MGDGLLIPVAIPPIAGPGAITTMITFSSQNTSGDGSIAMAIAYAAVAIVTFLFSRYLGDLLARVKPTTIAILARLGGCCWRRWASRCSLNGLENCFG